MARIEKKSWPEIFKGVASGDKAFDLRLGDFKCKPGDVLVLREWDPKKKAYTGKVLEKKVTYVMKTKGLKFWPEADVKKHGFMVLSLK